MRELSGRVDRFLCCEFLRKVPHIQLVRDVGLEGSRNPLGQHISPDNILTGRERRRRKRERGRGT